MSPKISCVPRAGDNAAPPLAEQAEGGLAREVMGYAPDLGSLTFAHRLIYAADAHLSRAPRPALRCPAPPAAAAHDFESAAIIRGELIGHPSRTPSGT